MIPGLVETISPVFQQEASSVRAPGGQGGVESRGEVRKAEAVGAAVGLADLPFAQRLDEKMCLSRDGRGSKIAGGTLPAAL